MTARRAARARGVAAGVLLLPTATGCYRYAPVPAGSLAPGTPVELTINDRGRVGLTGTFGPGLLGLEGTLASRTDTTLVVSVSEVRAIGGGASRWAGDTVIVRQDYVQQTAQRRISRGRTAVALAALGAAVVLIATQSLNGLGGNGGGGSKQPPDQGGGT